MLREDLPLLSKVLIRLLLTLLLDKIVALASMNVSDILTGDGDGDGTNGKVWSGRNQVNSTPGADVPTAA
jgi:hypothetical protein